MKICLHLIPLMVCVALVPARAADPTPATAPADKEASDAASDLPKHTDPLIDPLTGTPYLAVHNGDIVECAAFMIEFQRAHPSEHTLLLIADIHDPTSSVVDPAVAYTWKGKAYIHSYEIGDVRLTGLGPEHVSEGYMSRLHKTYIELMRYYFQKYYESQHISYPLSQEQAYKLGAADLGAHELPNELPGDTEDIQTKRVVLRLMQLGLRIVKVFHNIPHLDKYGKTYTGDEVNFNFEGFTFEWTRRGCGYLCLASKTYLPGLLDSLIFSIDYQKANPSEKVFCFLHEAGTDHHIASTTVFTKNGQLWFHHLPPRDLLSSLSLDDLRNSDRVNQADLAVYNPSLKEFYEEDDKLRRQPPSGLKRYLNGYKNPDISVEGVLAELQKRGVEARIINNTDSPALLFVWGKKPFIYRPLLGCFPGKAEQMTASN
ncbi:MAG TPA: hypothetical protein VNU49_01115 [Opitutaceae bacterium]|jgi:hypothetical protein|nr:hypothetical protein [Opitutaceae bacterium]